MMDNESLRVNKVKKYICEKVLDNECLVNVDFLSNDPDNYSVNRIPVEPIVENWIIPMSKYKEIYNFSSRMPYGADEDDNLSNIGFFEKLENKIKVNNKNRILPDIKGIESIECLNVGSLQVNETQTAVFSIQIQIVYREGR